MLRASVSDKPFKLCVQSIYVRLLGLLVDSHDGRRQEGSLLRSLSLRSFPTSCNDSRITCVAFDVTWAPSGCSLLAGFGRDPYNIASPPNFLAPAGFHLAGANRLPSTAPAGRGRLGS